MRGTNVVNRKALIAEKRLQFSRFSKCRNVGEYLAMMRSTFARDQRKQGKHAPRNESEASECDPQPRLLTTWPV